MKRSATKLALNLALIVAPAMLMCQQNAAHAATVQGVNPDVETVVWQEDNSECASVSLNGKELLTFKGEPETASAQAEDLAAHLQEVLDDRKFDASDILPYKAGARATIQRDGNTILTFDPPASSGDEQPTVLESSLKLVNGIRAAFGAPVLPASFLKLVDQAERKIASDGKGLFSGTASWYGAKFHGRKMSNGNRYDQDKLTAAHRSLPFGTKLLVMNRRTGSTCFVEVNDRGPFVADRVIDLSRGAARQLNMLSTGVALVDCLIIGPQ